MGGKIVVSGYQRLAVRGCVVCTHRTLVLLILLANFLVSLQAMKHFKIRIIIAAIQYLKLEVISAHSPSNG